MNVNWLPNIFASSLLFVEHFCEVVTNTEPLCVHYNLDCSLQVRVIIVVVRLGQAVCTGGHDLWTDVHTVVQLLHSLPPPPTPSTTTCLYTHIL